MRNNNSMARDLTSGSVAKSLLIFSLPLLLSGVLQTVYNTVDMIVVGRFVGSTGQSAVSIGGDILNILTILALAFSNAGSVCISQYVGAGRMDKVKSMIGTMSTILMGLSIVVAAVCFLLCDNILGWLNAPKDAFGYAREYIITCVAGLLFIYGYNIVSAVLRGMGDSKHPFLFVAIAAVMNLLLDLLFVAVFDWGPFGAALATVIGQSFSFICSAVFLYIKRDEFGFDFRLKSFAIDGEVVGPFLKLGLPLTFQFAAIQLSMTVINSWINVYGVIASAVTGIGSKLSGFATVFNHALSTATSTLVGQNLGAKKYDRVSKTLRISLEINMALGAVITVVFLLFSKQIYTIFNQEAEVLELAASYTPVFVVMIVGSSLRCSLMGLINGSGNSKLNLVVALLDGVIFRLGLAILLGRVFHMGIVGYWYGHAFAGIVPFFIGAAFYLSGHWRTHDYLSK